MTVLGIDPGMAGGLALRGDDGGKDWVLVEPMPICETGVDLAELARWLSFHRTEIRCAFLELAGMRPGQATQSCFKFARYFGAIEGMLHGLCISHEIVRPQTWSDEFPHGVEERSDKKLRQRLIKDARRAIAQRLFPGVDLRETERSKIPHEGMTDALLIAEYGHRKLKGRV